MSDARSAKPPLILILGPGKSGTTALFFCLKGSAERHFGLEFPHRFEPKTAADVDAFAADFGVAKMLLERYERTTHEFLSRFDKRVFIFRDPRDNVISRLVYYAGTRLKSAEPSLCESILQKFLAKERDPDSISVLELFDVIAPLMGPGGAKAARNVAYKAASFIPPDGHPFFRIRYEEFADGRVAALGDYLGFEVTTDFQTPERLQRVRRTKTYGYWQNWFTDDDYDFFVRAKRDELVRMGYADVRSHVGPKRISPVEISDYLQRQLRR